VENERAHSPRSYGRPYGGASWWSHDPCWPRLLISRRGQRIITYMIHQLFLKISSTLIAWVHLIPAEKASMSHTYTTPCALLAFLLSPHPFYVCALKRTSDTSLTRFQSGWCQLYIPHFIPVYLPFYTRTATIWTITTLDPLELWRVLVARLNTRNISAFQLQDAPTKLCPLATRACVSLSFI